MIKSRAYYIQYTIYNILFIAHKISLKIAYQTIYIIYMCCFAHQFGEGGDLGQHPVRAVQVAAETKAHGIIVVIVIVVIVVAVVLEVL